MGLNTSSDWSMIWGGQTTWKTFACKRLLISDDVRVRSKGLRVEAREYPRPAPRLSRDLHPALRSLNLSAAVAATETATARKILLEAARIPPPRRGPALLPLALQSPRLPTCPSAWVHPALGRPHPGGAARPSSRASSVYLQQAIPPAVRLRGAAEPEAWDLAPRRRDPQQLRRRY